MSEYNDYKWYDENNGEENKNVHFYTETVTENKKEKRKNRMKNVAMVVMAAVMLTSVATTGYVLYEDEIKGTVSNIERKLSLSDKETSFKFQQLTDGEKTPMSTVDIATNVGPAVVGISTSAQYMSFFGQMYEQEGSGSGIIISSDGYIVTNNHVIEGAKSISVILNTGEEYSATLVGTDAKTDLAVLKISASDLTVATLGDSSVCSAGELAVAIGNPLGQELAGTVTVGVISAVNRSIQADDGTNMILLQTDAAINPGNSGGALVNGYGEIVGINTMKFSGNGVEGIGFAIPVNTAKPIIADLIANGYVKGRPLIGLSLREISPELAAVNDMPAGLYVADVSKGGAAEKAGIRKGDIIVAVQDKIVESAKEVNEIRDKYAAGDTIKIEVSRDGQKKQFSVILQEDTTSRVSN